MIWGADKKKGLLDDSSLSLQPASVPTNLYFQVKSDQTGNVFIPFLSVMSEAAVRHSLSATSYRFTVLFRASSFTTIDLWINPKQNVINSEPLDKVSSSLFIPSVIWCWWMLITSYVSLWPRRWSILLQEPHRNPIRTWATGSASFVSLTMRCVDVAGGGQGVSSVMVPVGMKINDTTRPVSPV